MTEKETAPDMWYEALDPLDPCVDAEDYPNDKEIEAIEADIKAEYGEALA